MNPAEDERTTLYAVFGTDHAGAAATRAAVRASHRAYLREPHPDGLVVVLGGPTLDDDGAMNGTLLVVRATSVAAVHRFLAADPYGRRDLYASVVVREWRCGLARIDLLGSAPN